jgi:glyoxylase-like metal-dependent hydrolase (beta-lactamase superfamily II)
LSSSTRVLAIIPGSLYQITLPLPFELEQVNVHLVRLDADGGWMLIDSGFGNTRSFDLLEASLRELDVDWPQIRVLLLTHLHPDHVGLAERIAALAHPKIVMHEAEAAHLNEMIEAGKPTWFEPLHVLGGTPRDELQKIDLEFAPMRRQLRRVDPDLPLHGGETLPSAFGPLEVVYTPGHSPGHICLYSRERRLLFSGDTILKDITPNIAWLPGRDMLGEYLESLQKLAKYDVGQILPSHGMPFEGHREWIAATTAHHEERCQQILAGASVHRTAHELIASVWTRKFSTFHYHFAIGEVLAHLVYLESTGRVERRMAANGAAEWTAIRR